MKEVKLKSGKVLGLGDTPFQTSKELFQAFLRCMDGVDVANKDQFDFALTADFSFKPGSGTMPLGLHGTLSLWWG